MTSALLARLSPVDVARWSRRARAIDAAAESAAQAILDDIDARGDQAVLDHARRLGDLRAAEPAVLMPADLSRARDRIPPDQRRVLERTAERIRTFALAQRRCIDDCAVPIPGGQAGHTCVPVATAGCYAPGGRFPLPSSVLMTAVTARAAGVEHVIVASPRPTDVTLAAASIAGADALLAIGGAQAIGTLARGLFGLPRCDLIVGPGNRWVTAAKHLVSRDVGIDMLAGPSELLVLADDAADPAIIAADLLAQAEHDDDAVPMLLATDFALIERVEQELNAQLQTLRTRSTAAAALRNGFACHAPSIEEMLRLADLVGAEHLELQTRDAQTIARRIRAAGAIFIGSRSAEVFGDYGFGPNHVLPTGGTARFRAGLSVMTFLRIRTWLRIDDSTAAGDAAADAIALARLESLEAHARAAERRVR